MDGQITNYKMARHHTTGNQMIVQIPGVDSKEKAEKYVGKKVTWNSGKKDIVGEVRSAHGNKGCLRVLFETGMPGQAIAGKVKVL
ncbi:MAG: 50S ribosomal protein L35ae [Candidatus Woesearchaeota archaeon]